MYARRLPSEITLRLRWFEGPLLSTLHARATSESEAADNAKNSVARAHEERARRLNSDSGDGAERSGEFA